MNVNAMFKLKKREQRSENCKFKFVKLPKNWERDTNRQPEFEYHAYTCDEQVNGALEETGEYGEEEAGDDDVEDARQIQDAQRFLVVLRE